MSTRVISQNKSEGGVDRKRKRSSVRKEGPKISSDEKQQGGNFKKKPRKNDENSNNSSGEKPARLSRKDERRDLLNRAKETWEKLRSRANNEEEAGKLASEIYKLVKGRLEEFVFRHDGSRIIQWIFKCGNTSTKEAIVDELVNSANPASDQQQTKQGDDGEVKETLFSRILADRYARHIVVKVMKRSNTKDRTRIFDAHIHPHVPMLMRQMYGVNILDVVCTTLLNAQCRSKVILSILFSKSTTYLKLLSSVSDGSNDNKASGPTSKGKSKTGTPAGELFLQAVEKVDEEFRGVIRENAYETISSLLEKDTVLSFEIVHSVVHEWLMDAIKVKDVDRVRTIASSLAPNLVHFVHTRSGLSVAITCIKILDAKHRKKVVRSIRGYFRKLVLDRCSHRVVLTLMRWIDDTRIFGKAFSTELCTTENVAPETSMDIDTKASEESADKDASKVQTKSRGGLSRAEKKMMKKKKPENENDDKSNKTDDGEKEGSGNDEKDAGETVDDDEEEANEEGDSDGDGEELDVGETNTKPELKEKGEEEETEEEDGIDISWMLQMCNHKFGRTLFLYLLFGEDTRYFNPETYGLVWEPLDTTIFKETSKKDEKLRREELLQWISKGLCMVIRKKSESLLLNPLGGAILVGAAMHEELKDALVDGIVSTLKCDTDADTICNSKVGRRVLAAIFKVGGSNVAQQIRSGLAPDIVKHIKSMKNCDFFEN